MLNKNLLAARQAEIDLYRNKFNELSKLADNMPEGVERDKVIADCNAAYDKSAELFNAAMKEFGLSH